MNTQKYNGKSFEHWTREEVEMTFGIARNDALPTLATWLDTHIELTEKEKEAIAELLLGAREELDLYNEDELKLFFISVILQIVKFKSKLYRAFTQRQMEFTTLDVKQHTITVKGIVELVVATGKQTPQKPFFFLQEFKQALKRNNDPLGQLLIAMFCAQVLNDDHKPIYGCYVLGQHWYFVVLEGKEYAVSIGYDASISEGLTKIIQILKAQKNYVESTLA